MPKEVDLKHAPEVIRASWDHKVDLHQNKRWNITPLLRLQAYRSGFEFDFIPYRLAMEMEPEWIQNSYDYKDWEVEQGDEIIYMLSVQAVVKNQNAAWLDAVRSGGITVEFVVNSVSKRATIMIRCKSCFCLGKDHSKGAKDLLRTWGLLGSLGRRINSNHYAVSFK